MSSQVIIVDDNLDFVVALREYLSELAGLNVLGHACSGEDALKLLKACKPEMVILDLIMPGLNGYALIPIIKGRYPNLQVIILSMQDSERSKQAVLELGADGFVSKAKMITDLVPEIHRLLPTVQH